MASKNQGLIRHNEAQVQIVNYLRLALPGCMIIKAQNEDDLHRPGIKAWQRAARRKRAIDQGLYPGASDLQVIASQLPVKALFVEVKTGVARLNDNQKVFMDHARELDCWAIKVAHFEEVQAFLESKGVKLNAY